MKPQFLSTTELAKLLNLSRVAIFQKIKKGEIKAVKIGRSYAINKSDLPFLSEKTLTAQKMQLINQAVRKTAAEYGQTLRLLGKE